MGRACCTHVPSERPNPIRGSDSFLTKADSLFSVCITKGGAVRYFVTLARTTFRSVPFRVLFVSFVRSIVSVLEGYCRGPGDLKVDTEGAN